MLRTIGATEHAEHLEKLLAFFPERTVPKDNGKRYAILAKLSKLPEWRSVELAASKHYWDNAGNYDLLMVQYIREHKDEFLQRTR